MSLLGAVALLLAWSVPTRAQNGGPSPVIVVETTRGTFEIETFPDEAPRSVAHITELAKNGFYDGIRVHRVLPGFVAQFGDPQTRDVSLRSQWGHGDAASSGKPVGISEISRKRGHRVGAVGLAHTGEPAKADSQLYIMLAPHPELNGKYTVFGQISAGADVPAHLEIGDTITRMYLKQPR